LVCGGPNQPPPNKKGGAPVYSQQPNKSRGVVLKTKPHPGGGVFPTPRFFFRIKKKQAVRGEHGYVQKKGVIPTGVGKVKICGDNITSKSFNNNILSQGGGGGPTQEGEVCVGGGERRRNEKKGGPTRPKRELPPVVCKQKRGGEPKN